MLRRADWINCESLAVALVGPQIRFGTWRAGVGLYGGVGWPGGAEKAQSLSKTDVASPMTPGFARDQAVVGRPVLNVWGTRHMVMMTICAWSMIRSFSKLWGKTGSPRWTETPFATRLATSDCSGDLAW